MLYQMGPKFCPMLYYGNSYKYDVRNEGEPNCTAHIYVITMSFSQVIVHVFTTVPSTMPNLLASKF